MFIEVLIKTDFITDSGFTQIKLGIIYMGFYLPQKITANLVIEENIFGIP